MTIKELTSFKKEQQDIKAVHKMGELTIKKYLPFEKKGELAMMIANLSFDGNQYAPIMREINEPFLICTTYCKDLPTKKNDKIEAFNILKATGVIDLVLSSIDKSELDSIRKMIDELIELKRTPKTIAQLIEEFVSNFDAGKLEEQVKQLEKISPETMKVLQGIVQKDIK